MGHLLDVFTSADANSDDVWDACFNFLRHLYWHKPRLVALTQKIERLPDDHRSARSCLAELSRLFGSVRNCVEEKRLLTRLLQVDREQGGERRVAWTSRRLSDANRQLGLFGEGI